MNGLAREVLTSEVTLTFCDGVGKETQLSALGADPGEICNVIIHG